ncbi:MAG: 4Fe-4S binding protein [Chloroflexi bacterium]|nr:4Fe-4S binding protein [Chloroflexota bacterium]
MKGLITNVQRFSIHDGPGIRTTVFLKGCPLNCFWCHNPEALHGWIELQVFPERCIGCNACLERCPVDAQRLEDGRRVTQRELCRACGRCVETCYAEALVLAGRWWSAEELVETLLRDRDFYARSGGRRYPLRRRADVPAAFQPGSVAAVSSGGPAHRHRDGRLLPMGGAGRVVALA